MKLKRFQKRFKVAMKQPETQEVVAEARQPARYIAVGLAILALLLLVIFVVWPLVSHRGQKPKVSDPNRRSLFYTLQNISNEDWKGVKLTIEGPGTVEAEGINLVTTTEGDANLGTKKYVFSIGDVQAGQTKKITIFVTNSKPGLYGYKSSFLAADGTLVQAVDYKTTEVQ